MRPDKMASAAGIEPCKVEIDEQDAVEREVRLKWESLRPQYIEWARKNGETLEAFDEIVDARVESARSEYHKKRAYAELEDASVIWDRVTSEDCSSLLALLDSEPKESEVHRFLENNPKFLIQTLSTGHGRFQISKPRLGAEFIPDFLLAELSSIGIEWHLVEIETPSSQVERKDGRPTQHVNHAIGQIRDWRTWLMNNLDYARRPEDQDGLGLVGIDPRAPGLIIIGRRQNFSSEYNEFRRILIDRERIVIHSYDWILDVARSNRSGRLRAELHKSMMH